MTVHDSSITRDLADERRDDPLHDPVEVFRKPDNRIKLLLVIAALAALNLILLAWVLTEVSAEPEVVEVEGQRCIVVEEEETSALYCRR